MKEETGKIAEIKVDKTSHNKENLVIFIKCSIQKKKKKLFESLHKIKARYKKKQVLVSLISSFQKIFTMKSCEWHMHIRHHLISSYESPVLYR